MKRKTLLLVLLSVSLGIQEGVADISSDQLEEQLELARRNQIVCGPISAWYCLRRLGHNVDSEELIKNSPLTENGINVEALLRLVRSFEPSAMALGGKPENLADLPVPSILLLEDHCVVYEGLDVATGQVRIFEPVTRELRSGPVDDVTKVWNGEVIVFSEPRLPRTTFVVTVVLVAIVVAGPFVTWSYFPANKTR